MGKTRNFSKNRVSNKKQQQQHQEEGQEDDEQDTQQAESIGTASAPTSSSSADRNPNEKDDESDEQDQEQEQEQEEQEEISRRSTGSSSSSSSSGSLPYFVNEEEKREYMEVLIRIARELNLRRIAHDLSRGAPTSSSSSSSNSNLAFEQRLFNHVVSALTALLRDRTPQSLLDEISTPTLQLLLQHLNRYYHTNSVLTVPRVTFLVSLLVADQKTALRLMDLGVIPRILLVLSSSPVKFISKRHALGTISHLSVWSQLHPSIKKELLQKDLLKKLVQYVTGSLALARQKSADSSSASAAQKSTGSSTTKTMEEEEATENCFNLLKTLGQLLVSNSEKELKKSAQLIVDSGINDLIPQLLRHEEKRVSEKAVFFLRHFLFYEPARLQLQKNMSISETIVNVIMTTDHYPELLERACGSIPFLAKEPSVVAELSKRKDLVKRLVHIIRSDLSKTADSTANARTKQQDKKQKRKQSQQQQQQQQPDQSEEYRKELGEQLHIAAYNALSSLCQSCPDDMGEFLESLGFVELAVRDLKHEQDPLKHCAAIACFNLSDTAKTNTTHVIRRMLDLKILSLLTSIVKTYTEKTEGDPQKVQHNPLIFGCVSAIKNIVTTATLDGNEANTEIIAQTVAVDDILKQILQALDEQERARKDEGSTMSFRRVITWMAALIVFLVLLPFIFRLIKHGRLI